MLTGRNRTGLVFSLVAAAAVLAGAQHAHAGIITAGNTHPSFGDTDVIVNFAVFENESGDFGAIDGALNASWVNDTSKFLYLYQVIVLGPADIEGADIEVNTSLVSSFGTLATTGFTFGGTTLTAGGDPSLGPTAPPGNPQTPPVILLDPLTLGMVGFDTAITAETATTVSLIGANIFAAKFTPYPGFDFGESVIFGFTSDQSPVIGFVSIDDGVDANGTIPTADNDPDDAPFPTVPEPASLAVWGGLSVLGLVFGRRFGKKAA